ncbi:MAG TPA: GntR family transcriptional regulator [Mycobacteriales bacterium]|nr:GntR family transcriptional regulator [Mycobacteriales bacterium]
MPAERSARRLRAVRTKTSSAVVEHVLDEVFEGRLRAGDRIDLDEISAELGVSRLPVREAMVILERDGIVSTTYHRGVYVEPFDAASISDEFEIFGLLSGLAVRRLAEHPDPQTIAALEELVADLREAKPGDADGIFEIVQQIMTVEHRAGGSRRLRAELRSRTGFLPYVFRVGSGRKHTVTVAAHSAVLQAIVDGDGEAAARHRLEDIREAGRRAVRELQRRGVLT